MRKEYYFNKEFLKLLKLDNKKSYTRESIFNRIKELKLMKKRVRKRGRYGITKFFYYTSNFHGELEILRKKNRLNTRSIRKQFKLTYAKNILWHFVENEDLTNYELGIKLEESNFNFINSLEI